MQELDIAQKVLEDHKDVFADIVNGLLFQGREVVKVTDLEGAGVVSSYKAKGQLRRKERDVAKYWRGGQIRIAMLGLENQKTVDYDMPLRIISYDGTEYGKQVRNKDQKERYPVITLVLYFGPGHWKAPKDLHSRLKMPEEVKKYVSNYEINVFEMGYLTPEQVDLFNSDFKVVAEYFMHLVQKTEYKGDSQELQHVDEVLDLLHVMTGDDRFEEMQKEARRKKEEGEAIMKNWILDEAEERGIAKGEARGEVNGRRKAWASSIRHMRLTRNMTEEDAFEMLNVPQEERSKVKEMLEE